MSCKCCVRGACAYVYVHGYFTCWYEMYVYWRSLYSLYVHTATYSYIRALETQPRGQGGPGSRSRLFCHLMQWRGTRGLKRGFISVWQATLTNIIHSMYLCTSQACVPDIPSKSIYSFLLKVDPRSTPGYPDPPSSCNPFRWLPPCLTRPTITYLPTNLGSLCLRLKLV